MDHNDVENGNLIGKYAAGILPEEEELKFEDHYFTCDKCLTELHFIFQEKNTIENYILGQLSEGEKSVFGKHYLACRQCQEELKEKKMFLANLRVAIKEEITSITEGYIDPPGRETISPSDPREREEGFAQKESNIYWKIAAVILIILLSIPAWRGIQTFLKEPLTITSQVPAENISIFHLSANRASGEPISINLSPEQQYFILRVQIIDQSIANPAYQAEIVNNKNETIWGIHALRDEGTPGIYAILCSTSYFSAGNYTLKIYEHTDTGKFTGKQFYFPFTIYLKK